MFFCSHIPFLLRAGAAVINLLERTDFPDVLGPEWIFVRMHDAVVRCLATMVALGHSIKPTVAIESAAVSPKAAQVGVELVVLHGCSSRHHPIMMLLLACSSGCITCASCVQLLSCGLVWFGAFPRRPQTQHSSTSSTDC
jgi:hypothetical protein